MSLMSSIPNALVGPNENTRKLQSIAVDLLLNWALYQSRIDEDEGELSELLAANNTGNFDCYCVSCKRETPFTGLFLANSTGAGVGLKNPIITKSRIVTTNVRCLRCTHQIYTYVFERSLGHVTKIGQSPSLASIAHGELRHLQRGLGKRGLKAAS